MTREAVKTSCKPELFVFLSGYQSVELCVVLQDASEKVWVVVVVDLRVDLIFSSQSLNAIFNFPQTVILHQELLFQFCVPIL